MKIVFFGTSSFSVTILEHLMDSGHDVIAIVTKCDTAKGRSSQLLPPPVKEWATQHVPSIPLYQPLKASSQEFVACMQEMKADIFVVASYGEIMSEALLKACQFPAINVHASLLPAWRGAAPIQRAIMAGDAETGVTIMKMVLKLDAGDILEVARIPILPEDDHGIVQHRLALAAKTPLLHVLKQLFSHTAEGKRQDGEKVTFAPKIKAEELFINWNLPALEIHNQIRALSPEVGAWTYIEIAGQKKRMKIWKSSVTTSYMLSPQEGLINQGKEWVIGCLEGALTLHTIQIEGKKSLAVAEVLRGMATPPRIVQL
ncbi:MAG: methionyl-tRNA formyltransferase [Candidatus Rhabdochlamydia sp.]